MQPRSRVTKRFSDRVFIAGLIGLSFIASASILLHAKTTAAYRVGTANVCHRGLTLRGAGTLPNGKRYYTFEYYVKGNDYARAGDNGGGVYYENGWRIDSADPNCIDDSYQGQLWDGKTVDLNNGIYKFFFVGKNPDIYIGSLPGAPVSMLEDFDFVGGVGGGDHQDPATGQWYRDEEGVSKKPDVPYAALNDGGIVNIQGSTAFCFGMAVDEFTNDPVCQGFNEATIYHGGCDCAGYLNSGNPAATQHLAEPWRTRVANHEPINGDVPYPKFDMRIYGMNTRDGLFGKNYAKCNWTVPGTSPCVGPDIKPDPDLNNKLGFLMTFVIDLKTPIGTANISCNPATGNFTVTGWAADPNYPQTPVHVVATLDGTLFNGGRRSDYILANDTNADALSVLGPTFGSQHGYKIDLSRFSDAFSHDVHVYVLGVYDSAGDYDPNGFSGYAEIGARQLGPCAPVDCLSLPISAETGVAFSAQAAGYQYDHAGPQGAKVVPNAGSITFNGQTKPVNFESATYGNSAHVNTATTPASNYTFTMNAPGQYPISWTVIQFPSWAITCNGMVTVTNRPYVSFFGNDVSAGGGYQVGGNPCVQPGKILAYDNPVNDSGAGVEFAAMALDKIDQFMSATVRSAPPQPPDGLSFANVGASAPGNFGSSRCVTDYWNGKAPSVPAAIDTAITLPDPRFNSPSNNYYLIKPSGGTLTLDGSVPSIPAGRQLALYVQGNVVINSPITFAGGPWGSVANIPSFFLIVQGNIYIAPNVTQLDGIYIAQPTDLTKDVNTSGRIYTCANNGTGPINMNGLFTDCSQPLIINGAFIAQQTKLLRTHETLHDAQPHELPPGAGGSPSNAAEVFNFSPETYLAIPGMLPTGKAVFGQYNSLTSLPPIL